MLYPQRGRTQLFQLIAAYIRDNALNQITPADIRRVLKELVSSDWNRADDGGNNGGGNGNPAQLADFITLDEAQQLLAAPAMSGPQPGVLYVIAGSVLAQWNGGSTSEVVCVEGLADAFASTGWVLDSAGSARAVEVDVAAGTWTIASSGLVFLDPYDVPAAKRRAVVDANTPAVLETDSAYYGCEFVDEVYGPGQPAYYKCMPSAPAQTGGATVWKWFRIDIL